MSSPPSRSRQTIRSFASSVSLSGASAVAFHRWLIFLGLMQSFHVIMLHLFNNLDLNVPLFAPAPTFSVFPQNVAAVATTLPLFLCPSDPGTTVTANFGPGNYVGNSGSGVNGGVMYEANGADGILYANSWKKIADITDGTSNTVLMSETIKGSGAADTTTTPVGNAFKQAYKVYNGTATTPLTDATCAGIITFRYNRGYSWADGGAINGMYNHYYQPNSATPDCSGRSSPGWKAARSWHTGGVQGLMCDGSVRFFSENIDSVTWRSLATRAGGEVVGEF